MHDLLATCRVVQTHEQDKNKNHLTGTEHMVIIVTLEDGSKWLTDVGFGGHNARHPLRIDQPDSDPPKDSKTFGKLQFKCYQVLLFPQYMRTFAAFPLYE